VIGAPLQITEFGSYFVGGREVAVAGESIRTIQFSAQAALEHDPNGLYRIEQAYVQFYVPVGSERRLPIVLLHGGCLTGAMWETTPDGRPGWLDRFLRAGFPVHVVDGVERGRAGWCALPSLWPDEPLMRSAEQIWALYRFGPEDGFATRRTYPGLRYPLAGFDNLLCQHVPRWLSTVPAAAAAVVQLLERVGPAIIVSHSNGGLVALEATWQRPDLVAGLVAIEPAGFPTAPPPAALAGTPMLLLMGDYLDQSVFWRGLAAGTAALAASLRNVSAAVTEWHLPSMGISGNSHMPMMDDNSDDLVVRLSDWIRSEVKPSQL